MGVAFLRKKVGDLCCKINIWSGFFFHSTGSMFPVGDVTCHVKKFGKSSVWNKTHFVKAIHYFRAENSNLTTWHGKPLRNDFLLSGPHPSQNTSWGSMITPMYSLYTLCSDTYSWNQQWRLVRFDTRLLNNWVPTATFIFYSEVPDWRLVCNTHYVVLSLSWGCLFPRVNNGILSETELQFLICFISVH
jgi:hypothetical protein